MDKRTLALYFACMLVVVAYVAPKYPEQALTAVWAILAAALLERMFFSDDK